MKNGRRKESEEGRNGKWREKGGSVEGSARTPYGQSINTITF